MEKKNEDVPEIPRKQKELREIFYEQVEAGLRQYDRPAKRLFISSFGAGLEIGFSIFLMGVLYTLLSNEISKPAMDIVLAAAYSLGFVFVVIGRSELFTEETSLAMLPVLSRKVPVSELFRFGVPSCPATSLAERLSDCW